MAAVSESPVVDLALSSMLDDLQEGTLMSLLEDSDLFSCLQDYPLSLGGDADVARAGGATGDDFDLSELFGDDMEFMDFDSAALSSEALGVSQQQQGATDSPDRQSECSPQHHRAGRDNLQGQMETSPVSHSGSETDVSSLDSNDSDTAEDSFAFVPRPSKRFKPETEQSNGGERNGLFLTACVQHDHCYTRPASQQHESFLESTDKDAAIATEEENSSDTGYDTMSSSTSPGGSTGSKHSSSPTSQASPGLPPPLPALNAHLDPVALIDARIKHFMRSHQINLTEEEKETLKAEGLPIPTTLPLTKVEERALKSVRRKIRNKVAAQESRKRKKEHTQDLEDKVRLCTSDNLRLQKKVESLESENRSLMAQLQKFKALVSGGTNGRHTTKVGACLMMVVLCFAVFLGGWAPPQHSYWTSVSSDYATTTVRSRSLLSLEVAETTFPQTVCDWFRYTFLPDKHLHTEHSDPHTMQESSSVHTWPDIYLSSYTPLAVYRHNDSTSVVA